MSNNLTNDAKNLAVYALAPYVWVSLHTNYSATGDNELIDAAYLRMLIGWNIPVAGLMDFTAPIVWPAGIIGTIKYIGIWDADVGGNFMGMAPAQSGVPNVFMCNDTTNGLIFCQGHPFVDGETVIFWSGGETFNFLPSGFAAGFEYTVTGSMVDYFQVFDPFGTPDAFGVLPILVPSAAGVGWAQKMVPAVLTGIQDLILASLQVDSRMY